LAALTLLGLAALIIPRVAIGNLRELLRLVVGARVPPLVVAWVRRVTTGLVEDTAEILTLATIVAGVVETGWCALDQVLKPKQNAVDPKPVAGGGPPGPVR
jgi:hypothetical protein